MRSSVTAGAERAAARRSIWPNRSPRRSSAGDVDEVFDAHVARLATLRRFDVSFGDEQCESLRMGSEAQRGLQFNRFAVDAGERDAGPRPHLEFRRRELVPKPAPAPLAD